ncbi:hypothetical protein TI39_contig259g00007 [Zymoseptoria brevis]|uniref:Uncharacterized protein n=1 Tax=Zymoseptoria brevis TaxID=1047168 RepID=A0A0F4H0T7_9PEZI|nr:hypothetical protein TI39_contig259g00007 [Zymoseptoria brevis]
MPKPRSPKKKADKKRVRSESPCLQIVPHERDWERARAKPSERRKEKRKKEAAKVKAKEPESEAEDKHSESFSDDDDSGSDTSDTSTDDVGSSPLGRMTAPRRATKAVLPWSRKASKKEMLKSLDVLTTHTLKSRLGSCCIQQMVDCWLGDPAQIGLPVFFAEMRRELLARKVKPHKLRGVREGLCRGAAVGIAAGLKQWVQDDAALHAIAAELLLITTTRAHERSDSNLTSPEDIKCRPRSTPKIVAPKSTASAPTKISVASPAKATSNAPKLTSRGKRKADVLVQESDHAEDGNASHFSKLGYPMPPITDSKAGPSKRPRLATTIVQSAPAPPDLNESAEPAATAASSSVPSPSKHSKLPKVNKKRSKAPMKSDTTFAAGNSAVTIDFQGTKDVPASTTRSGVPTPPNSSPGVVARIETKQNDGRSENQDASRGGVKKSKAPATPRTKSNDATTVKVKEEDVVGSASVPVLSSPMRYPRAATCPPPGSLALPSLPPLSSHRDLRKAKLGQDSAPSSFRSLERRPLLPAPCTISHSALARKNHSKSLILLTGTPDNGLTDLREQEVKRACDDAGLISHSIRRCGPLAWIVEPFHFAFWMLNTIVKICGREIKPESIPSPTGRYYIADITGMQLQSQDIFAAVRATFAPADKYKFSVHRLLDAKRGRGKAYVLVQFMFPPRVLAFYPSLLDVSGNVVRPAFKPMDQRRPCRYCADHGGGVLCKKAMKAVDGETANAGGNGKEGSLHRRT